MEGFVALFTVVASTLIGGLIQIASGQMLHMLREMALNSRKEGGGDTYRATEIVGGVLVAFGYVTFIVGGAFAIFLALKVSS